MEPVACQVVGVYLAVHDLGAAPVVLLEVSDQRYLPIFIGLYEAVSINNAINGPPPARPLTHDLFSDTLSHLQCRVRDVRIDSIEDGVYYATMHLETSSGELAIDCRPSDGIALAVRQQAAISLDLTLIAEAAVVRDDLPELRDFSEYIG
ncbi:MAG: bifunctional nuclease family protein [Methanocalculus sp. MSAO_Arc1]|uniref:bifunctional nuclease family protein n=1 Tax=Methanocalculus TaxID=71151 RepID=UPI000FF56B17|nr:MULTISPECIES: bifunctional nuclease family protein [unclassified Methanocalculus]MCP1662305.1 bifunctional DNase/RNase [Methanocalculus sp. AMF5]RQD80933.1 MAG: bifunctional nuclease family protein [Methanocalculus sp. MSAO_Arc1]